MTLMVIQCHYCCAICCAVLCCAVLCCAVLCCAVLCCAVLCCAVHVHVHVHVQLWCDTESAPEATELSKALGYTVVGATPLMGGRI
jgi:hypothetical protein